MSKAHRSPQLGAAPSGPLASPDEGEAQEYGNAFAAELVSSSVARPDGEVDAGAAAPAPAPAPAPTGGLPVTLALAIHEHQQPQTASLADYPTLFGISTYSLRPAQTRVVSTDAGHELHLGIDVVTPWNIQSRGRTDVPSADSSVITASNWASVANDLRPQGMGRPRRDRYWSQSISTAHEQFHGRDDYAWTQRSAQGIMQGVLAGRTLPAEHTADQVRALVLDSLRAVAAGNDAYYGQHERGDGEAAGEHRAYGDGRDEYQALYDGIVQRARTEFIPRRTPT